MTTPVILRRIEEDGGITAFSPETHAAPFALRCGTRYIQPHELHSVVLQYLDGPVDSPSHNLRLLLDDPSVPQESQHITAVTQLWSLARLMCGYTLLFVLQLWPSCGLPCREKESRHQLLKPLTVHGSVGQAELGSDSAQHSTRVPLDIPNCDRSPLSAILSWSDPLPKEGNMGDMCPLRQPHKEVFYRCDDIRSQMHAVSDVGALVEWLQDHISFGHESKDNLAVLHNQNDMVRGFGIMSAWVSQSQKKVISACRHYFLSN